MPEITIPRTGAHLRKLFEILLAYPDGLQAAEALKKLAAVVEMTPYEAGLYESTGTRRFEKIVRFATVDCVKAGWLLKNKGIWSVTEAGKRAFSDFPNPEDFYREASQAQAKYNAAIYTRIPDLLFLWRRETSDHARTHASQSDVRRIASARQANYAGVQRMQWWYEHGGFDRCHY